MEASVARIYLRRDHAYPVVLEEVLDKTPARLRGETPPLVRHEDHVGDKGE